MTRFWRVMTSALVIGLACSELGAQRPPLPARPSFAAEIGTHGVLELRAGFVAAMLLPGGDTVFVQAVSDSTAALWDGRTHAADVGVTIRPGDPVPSPDADEVLHVNAVSVIFVLRHGPYLALGLVYRPLSRT